MLTTTLSFGFTSCVTLQQVLHETYDFFGATSYQSFEDLREETKGSKFCLNRNSGQWVLVLGRRVSPEDERAGLLLWQCYLPYTHVIVLDR